jgi:hypothetical protein
MYHSPNSRYLFLFISLLIVFLFQVITVSRIIIESIPRKQANTEISVGLKEYLSRAASLATAPSPSYHFEQIVEGCEGVLYGISNGNGLLVSFNEGRSWIKRNNGLPHKVVYPFKERALRRLTSVGVDPHREGRIAVTTANEIYLSEDYGISWEKIPTINRNPEEKGWPKAYTYFRSLSLSHSNRDAVLVGTSFDGFYETTDRGKSWWDPSEKAYFLSQGANFYEEVAGIAYDPITPKTILIGCGFGGSVYRWDPETETYEDLKFPGQIDREIIKSLKVILHNPVQESKLQVVTERTTWHFLFDQNSWQRVNYPHLADYREYPVDRHKAERIKRASDKRGIYINSYGATRKHFDEHIGFVQKHGLNSIVVDFKDDFGIITYDTRLELPRKIGAVDERFRAKEIIDRAHSLGIYVIARIIVFKDRAMYFYDNHRYAAWDRVRNWAWAHLFKFEDEETGEIKYYQKEHWVDPFSSFVWDYNLAVAKELQDLGVDEIQFDYIRFPTDGDLSTIVYRHRQEGMTGMDALESFLIKAREVITVPISTDLYGFNSWHRMGNWNGQNIEMVCDYVDVIAPMFYPSHFARDFLGTIPYLERARQIYRDGTERAFSIAGNRSIIRPYVQAFLIGTECAMTETQYSEYLKKQLRGTLSAPSSGYTLWNAANDYYMVTFSLEDEL